LFNKYEKHDNIFFAENDLDYLVGKKIREMSKNELNYTKHSLKNKTLKSTTENDSETKSQITKIIDALKNNILENPREYEFYFKDAKFELEGFLLKKEIIKPNLNTSKSTEIQNLTESIKNLETEKEEKENPEIVNKIPQPHISLEESLKNEIKEEEKKDKEDLIIEKIRNEMSKHEIKKIKKEEKKKGKKEEEENKFDEKSLKKESINIEIKEVSTKQGTEVKKDFNKKLKEKDDEKQIKKKEDKPLKFKFKEKTPKLKEEKEDIDSKSLLSEVLSSLN